MRIRVHAKFYAQDSPSYTRLLVIIRVFNAFPFASTMRNYE